MILVLPPIQLGQGISENYKDYDIISEKLLSELSCGILKLVPHEPHCVHNIFSVPKDSGGV